MLILPIVTTATGQVTDQSLWLPIAVLVISLINLGFSMSSAEEVKIEGFMTILLQVARGFSGGATLVGQIGCIGLLILWFV